jgi:Zn-dependent peptidase ImmA (M78 family)
LLPRAERRGDVRPRRELPRTREAKRRGAMSDHAEDKRSDAVSGAARAAYAKAEREAGGAASAVAPLQDLIAAYGLTVDEVVGLTRKIAATHLAAKAGRQLVEPGADGDHLSGYLYANARGGWILVHAGEPLVRRRFSIAHELGHCVLHFLPRLGPESADTAEFREELDKVEDDEATSSTGQAQFSVEGRSDEPSGGDVARMERDADHFAAEVLMPAVVCRRLVEERRARYGGKPAVLARLLATELLVSYAAMERRLTDLRLV